MTLIHWVPNTSEELVLIALVFIPIFVAWILFVEWLTNRSKDNDC